MRPAVPGGGSCGHAGCAARADVAPAAPCAGAPPLSAPHRTHRELRRASPRWCRRGTSAPRPSTIIEAGTGEHIKSSSCAAFPPERDPTQRFVHRVFDRRRAELGTSCAEHVLVEVDQVLCHVSSTYPPLGTYPHPRRLLVYLGGVGVRGVVAAECNVLGGERDLSLCQQDGSGLIKCGWGGVAR